MALHYVWPGHCGLSLFLLQIGTPWWLLLIHRMWRFGTLREKGRIRRQCTGVTLALNQLLLMCCCRLRPITPNQSSTSIAKYYRIFYMRLMKSFYIYGFACVNKLWNRPIALYFWNAAFYQVITRVYSIPRCANFGFHAAVDDNCRLHWQLLHRRLITRGRSRWAALAATEATIDSALIAAVRCSRIKTQSMWSHQSVNRNQISFSTHDSTQSSCRRKH